MGNISSVLKAKRKELGLTLAQIAEKIGVTEATVQRWESGNIKSLRHERIAKLADILGVTPSVLMGLGRSHGNDGLQLHPTHANACRLLPFGARHRPCL